MVPRDQAILQHIGLYRVTLRPILSRLFFGEGSCAYVLHRLTAGGLVQTRKGLRSNRSYYQLTLKGAGAAAVPADRSKPLGTQALHTHLSIAWFCCMQRVRRYRLEAEAVAGLLGGEAPPGDHCVEDDPKRPRVYRVYAPGPTVVLRNVLRQVGEHIAEARGSPTARDWMRARAYAFGVLVETDERRAALRELLSSGPRGTLHREAYVRVEVVPGVYTT